MSEMKPGWTLTGLIFAVGRSVLLPWERRELDLIGVGGCNLATFEQPFNPGPTAADATDGGDDGGDDDDDDGGSGGRDFNSHDAVFANNTNHI